MDHGFDSFEELEGFDMTKDYKNVEMFGNTNTGKTQKTLVTTKRTSVSGERNFTAYGTQYEESKMAFDTKFELDDGTLKTSTQKSKMKKNKFKAAKADPTQQFNAFSPREPDDIYEGLQRESVSFQRFSCIGGTVPVEVAMFNRQFKPD